MSILEGLGGLACHMVDVLIWGETLDKHGKGLKAVLQRLNEAGVTLNTAKCGFRVTEVYVSWSRDQRARNSTRRQ